LNLLTPWITLAIILILLNRVQYWINRHLFGVGLLAFRAKGIATIMYLLVLLPGVLLREGTRYLVAGMFNIRPAMILPPNAGEDGIVDVRVFHFLTFNPVFAAIIGASPFLIGMIAVSLIAYSALDVPAFLATLGTTDAATVREAFIALLNRPNFLLWAYLLFAIANTMMPTLQEIRSSWVIWLIVAMFFGFLAVIGLWNTIFIILAGPVSELLYALSAVFGVVLGFNLLGASIIWLVERLVERMTNQRIQYQPPAQATRPARARLPDPTSVKDIRLPVPPPPGATLPAPRRAEARLGSGQPVDQPTRASLPVRTSTDQEAEQPALPARATGTDVPARRPLPTPPQPLPGPERPPAIPLPGAPPPRTGAATESEREPAPGTGQQRPPLAPAARGAGDTARTAPLPGSRTGTPVGGTPVGGTPAISRSAPPAEQGRRPGTAAPAFDRQARPAPKPFSGSAEARSPSRSGADDFIDADVIDDDDMIDTPRETPRAAPAPIGSGRPASSSPFASRRDSGAQPLTGRTSDPRRDADQKAESPARSPGRPGGMFASLTPKRAETPPPDEDEDDLRYDKLDDTP
jgi:hypothetical protein